MEGLVPSSLPSRRGLLRGAVATTAGLLSAGCRLVPARREPLFRISLAEWSYHRALFAGELAPLDFPAVARRRHGLAAVEYVNTFFRDRARDAAWLGELRRRCNGEGVRSLLIMCDGLGALGDPDPAARTAAVERHLPWAEAAAFLGCHSIRVNARSQGDREEQARLAADGLRRLTEACAPLGIAVIVENHGGLSSDGAWLAGVIRRVDHPMCGTLPDFGNFDIGGGRRYDPYRGVAELMPFARGVSAKSHDFDETGEETSIDYHRMLRIVVAAGYRGHLGIEYEGERLSEAEGVEATRRLLERVRRELETGERA